MVTAAHGFTVPVKATDKAEALKTISVATLQVTALIHYEPVIPLTVMIAALGDGWYWPEIHFQEDDSGAGYYNGHGYLHAHLASGSGDGIDGLDNGDGSG